MNGEQLLNIAEASLLLSNETPELENSKIDLLIVLLDIEDALDKGRNLVLRSPELRSKINEKMDTLRGKIRDLMNDMDKNTLKNILERRGENLKTQFSV